MKQVENENEQEVAGLPVAPESKWYHHINFILSVLIVLMVIGIVLQARYK